MHPIISELEKEFTKRKIPEFKPGDTVRLSLLVKEGDKERIQNFEGVVIARKSGSSRETFTVRRVSFGIGVERTFFIYSPVIQKITVVRHGKVRRAKLFYIRELGGKKARIQELRNEGKELNASEVAETKPETTAESK
jgi:large subunit ribosomal protein L19